jgi:hypothetical protein
MASCLPLFTVRIVFVHRLCNTVQALQGARQQELEATWKNVLSGDLYISNLQANLRVFDGISTSATTTATRRKIGIT